MRTLFAIPSLLVVLFQAGTILSQDKKTDPDKTEPPPKEIKEVGGKSMDQWIEELHSKDRGKGELAIRALIEAVQTGDDE